MTAIQKDLWPDVVETDPIKVAAMYNKSSSNYTAKSMEDGWDSTYVMINTCLDQLVPLVVKKNIKASNGSLRLKVLDAGCADGVLADKVHFEHYGAALHGFDIADDMIALAQKTGKYPDLKIASLTEKLPYLSNSFDFIISNGVLGYVSTADPIHELLRVVKSGGYILINMRTHHFKDRGYENALNRLTEVCRVVQQQPFSAYPNNPHFKHEYRFILIQKH